MAKVLALILVVIIVATMLVPVVECTTAIEKSIDEVDLSIQKALDGVVTAAPSAKKLETQEATIKQTMIATSNFTKANAIGDEKQVAGVIAAYKIAVVAVLAATPSSKFTVIEESFKAAMLAPVAECATDVERCISKLDLSIQKALDGVNAAAVPTRKQETEMPTFHMTMIVGSALDKAKAKGDGSQLVGVTVAYEMAANAVLRAAPADKFKVMEETFKTAAGPYA